MTETTSKRKRPTVIILSWIFCCVVLLGAGMHLHGVGEELGANFLFAGLVLISFLYLGLIFRWDKEEK